MMVEKRSENFAYNVFSKKEMKYLLRLRLDCSFRNFFSPISSDGLDWTKFSRMDQVKYVGDSL